VSGNIIKAAITGDYEGLKKAVQGASGELDKLSAKAKSHSDKLVSIANKGTSALIGGAVAFAGVALKNGADLQESQDQLRNAIENTGGAYDALSPKIKAIQKTSEGLGFTYKETDDALTVLTRSTGNADKAIGLMGVTQDLARAKNISLADAAIAVAKASEGQLRPLKQLGIDLPVVAGGAAKVEAAQVKLVTAQSKYNDAIAAYDPKAKNHVKALENVQKAHAALEAAQSKLNDTQKTGETIVAALGAKLNGTAATAADSMKGKIAALHAKFTDMTAQLGLKLIPVVTAVGTKLGQLVDYFTSNHTALTALVIVVGTFVAAMVTVSIVSKVITLIESLQVAWGVLNAVILANPLVAFVASIVVLVGAIVLAYQHVAWFRAGVQTAFHAIQVVVGAVVSFIQSHWQLLLAVITGGMSTAVLFVVSHFDTIRNVASVVVSAIKGFFTGIPKAVSLVVDGIVFYFVGLPKRIVDAIGDITSKFTHLGGQIVAGIVQGIENAAGSLGSAVGGLLSHLPGGGLVKGALHFAHVPGYADGGFVPGPNGAPHLAYVHGGELVLNPRQQASAFGGGGQTVNNFPAGAAPAAVNRAQARWNRRNGRAAS